MQFYVSSFISTSVHLYEGSHKIHLIAYKIMMAIQNSNIQTSTFKIHKKWKAIRKFGFRAHQSNVMSQKNDNTRPLLTLTSSSSVKLGTLLNKVCARVLLGGCWRGFQYLTFICCKDSRKVSSKKNIRSNFILLIILECKMKRLKSNFVNLVPGVFEIWYTLFML